MGQLIAFLVGMGASDRALLELVMAPAGHHRGLEREAEQPLGTVPVGGGGGKIFKIRDQRINTQLQASNSVVRPSGGPQ